MAEVYEQESMKKTGGLNASTIGKYLKYNPGTEEKHKVKFQRPPFYCTCPKRDVVLK